MRVTNSRYSDEFRQDAVTLLKRTDRSYRQVARDLGVSVWSLRQWYKDSEMPKKSRKLKPETAVQLGNQSAEQRVIRLEGELQALRKENDSLRMDREILKKAAAFFAKESE